MTTLTIEIPDKETETIIQVLKKFGVKIKYEQAPNKLTQEIEQGLREAKEIKEGKRKPLNLNDI